MANCYNVGTKMAVLKQNLTRLVTDTKEDQEEHGNKFFAHKCMMLYAKEQIVNGELYFVYSTR